MLVHCHKTLADTINPVVITKTFTSANEQRRGILGSSSKCWLVCLKQETTYVAGWNGTFQPFICIPLINPNPLCKAILCSFCYQRHWRLHPRGLKWESGRGGEGGGGGQMSVVMQLKVLPICQLLVNPIQTLQNVFSILKKDRGCLLLLIGWKWWVGWKMIECPILFSAPHFLSHSATTD